MSVSSFLLMLVGPLLTGVAVAVVLFVTARSDRRRPGDLDRMIRDLEREKGVQPSR